MVGDFVIMLQRYLRLILNTFLEPSVAVGLSASFWGIILPLTKDSSNCILQYLYINKDLFIWTLLIYIIISFGYGAVGRRKNNIINELKALIVEKDRQLNQTHKILYNRYGEFAHFSNGIRFEEILTEFVNKNLIIDSAQIYRLTRNKYNNDVVFTLNYEKGYCKAGFDINSIFQTNYVLKYDVYIKFRREIWRRWRRMHDENLKIWEKEELYYHISQSACELVEKICDRFQKIDSIGIVNENDFSYYRLLSILGLILMGHDGVITFDDDIIGNIINRNNENDNRIERYLRRGKRTGVLGSILLENVFIFNHVGESRKNGRMYVSFYFEDLNIPYIMIFSFTPKSLSERTYFNEEITTLINDFKDALLAGGKKL